MLPGEDFIHVLGGRTDRRECRELADMRQGDSFYQLKKLSRGPPAGHPFSMERVEVGQGGGVTESIGSAGAKL